jgi:hypothetical protein
MSYAYIAKVMTTADVLEAIAATRTCLKGKRQIIWVDHLVRRTL